MCNILQNHLISHSSFSEVGENQDDVISYKNFNNIISYLESENFDNSSDNSCNQIVMTIRSCTTTEFERQIRASGPSYCRTRIQPKIYQNSQQPDRYKYNVISTFSLNKNIQNPVFRTELTLFILSTIIYQLVSSLSANLIDDNNFDPLSSQIHQLDRFMNLYSLIPSKKYCNQIQLMNSIYQDKLLVELDNIENTIQNLSYISNICQTLHQSLYCSIDASNNYSSSLSFENIVELPTHTDIQHISNLQRLQHSICKIFRQYISRTVYFLNSIFQYMRLSRQSTTSIQSSSQRRYSTDSSATSDVEIDSA